MGLMRRRTVMKGRSRRRQRRNRQRRRKRDDETDCSYPSRYPEWQPGNKGSIKAAL